MSNIGYKKAKPKTKRRAIIAAASVALALLLLLAGLWRISGYKRFFQASVEKWSRYYSVDEYLIYGMIYAESGGREQAQSSAGAVGLMQLMPQTAKWLAWREGIEYSEEMLLQGDYSIRLGCAYAAFLFERYDNYDCVIAAYNAGHGAVDRWLKDPEFSRDGKTLYRVPYAETENHIVRVNRARSIYLALYPPAG